jgi:hypothetical protein
MEEEEMGNFCTYCGKPLKDGEVCSCQNQTEQVKNENYMNNVMAGKKYSFISSSFMSLASLIPYRGRVYTDIEVDEEKMKISMTPKRKNKVPVVYFNDITEVNVSVKLSIYLVFVAIVCVILGFAEPPCFLLALFWIWIAVNRKITITLRNGDRVELYSNAKNPAINFANEIGQVLS